MGDSFPYANGYTNLSKQKMEGRIKERKGKARREKKHVKHSYYLHGAQSSLKIQEFFS
jgi:hypothetical protein